MPKAKKQLRPIGLLSRCLPGLDGKSKELMQGTVVSDTCSQGRRTTAPRDGGRRDQTVHRQGEHRFCATRSWGRAYMRWRQLAEADPAPVAVGPVGAHIGERVMQGTLGTLGRGLADGTTGRGICGGPVAHRSRVESCPHVKKTHEAMQHCRHRKVGRCEVGPAALSEAEEITRAEVGGYPIRWHESLGVYYMVWCYKHPRSVEGLIGRVRKRP